MKLYIGCFVSETTKPFFKGDVDVQTESFTLTCQDFNIDKAICEKISFYHRWNIPCHITLLTEKEAFEGMMAKKYNYLIDVYKTMEEGFFRVEDFKAEVFK